MQEGFHFTCIFAPHGGPFRNLGRDICRDSPFHRLMDSVNTSSRAAAGPADADTAPRREPLVSVPPIALSRPAQPFAPVIFTSAHSGRAYSDDLMHGVRLDGNALRRSEDCFVNELFETAPDYGAPLLSANFPRAFCDANREAWELDPVMFSDPLPDWVNTNSVRVAAGLGTIAKVVASGESIYSRRLPFKEAERRIAVYWRPFHDTLAALITDIRDRFGHCLVIDCHSMPTHGQGRKPVDFVLGDLHGAACASRVTRTVETHLQTLGYLVRRNDPYAGGYITRHYGDPANNVHVLQIEIARGLYMDEARFQPLARFPIIRAAMTSLIDVITRQAHDLVG
jgi:N-formylglutamate deformylase